MTTSIHSEKPCPAIDVPLRVSPSVGRLLVVGGSVLLLASGVWAFADHDRSVRWLHAYLWSWLSLLSVALGALFFVILQHLTAARWSVVVRRLAELAAASLPWLALGLLPVLAMILAGDHRLYHWNDPAVVAKDPVLQGKAVYLNAPFFVLRSITYLAIWSAMARFFLRQSVAQDESGDPAPTLVMRRWSGPAMIVFAITVNFAAFDWIMSLDPHWFSTIFGIYFFSGCVFSFLAFLILVLFGLQRAGRTTGLVTVEHHHDLGKLLFGFVMFWAYIAFSQYLLIWYANIPEETSWYLLRQSGGWQWFALCLLCGHFFFPFFGLLSRAARRDPLRLQFWSVWLLLARGLDLLWLILPQASAEVTWPGVQALTCLLGLAAFTAGTTLRSCLETRLVPRGDPLLQDSIALHNI